MQYDFIPLDLDKNPSYLKQIIDLHIKHQKQIADDSNNYLESIEEDIKKCYPHFYQVMFDGEFGGFVAVEKWDKNKNGYHSCTLCSCVIDKKYWGKPVKGAGMAFLDLLFNTYGLHKIKLEVFENNYIAKNFFKRLRFKHEATLKEEVLNNNKLINLCIYSIFKEDFYSEKEKNNTCTTAKGGA